MLTADLVAPSLHASALQDGSNGEQENTNSDSKHMLLEHEYMHTSSNSHSPENNLENSDN